MAKYLVGQDNGMWKLADAVQHASSGDIIDFQKGYCPEVGVLYIEKNLSFVGCAGVNENGGQQFYNVLTAQIFIKNSAELCLTNLWIQYNTEQSNIINCKGNSKVRMENVVLENSIEQGDIYPIVYSEDQGEITMERVQIVGSRSLDMRMYLVNSNIHMNQCTFSNCKIAAEKAEITVRNSTISCINSHVFNLYQSKLDMENTCINGYEGEEDRAAVWSSGCSIYAKDCTIRQPQFGATVYLRDNGYFECRGGSVTSISVDGGRVVLENTSIQEIIQAYNKSYICVMGEVKLYGENDGKVDVYVGDRSVIRGDKLRYHRIANPNTRIAEGSLFDLTEVEYEYGEVSELVQITDDTSKIAVSKQNAKATSSVNADGSGQSNAREQLNQMIGLQSVKKEIDKMLRMVEFNQQRIAKGLEPQEQSFHSVFLGNPGTGKTTVARLIGEVLFESGAFKSDEFKLIEASEPDFISQNVGGTAQQTLALLEKAKGGVLFIDEAYALNKKDANVNFGIEAINTILKYMEDHRGEIMIIFAGYTKEMEQFLKTNPGLTSRIPNKFVFEDYTPEEIIEIGTKDLFDKQYKFEDMDYYEQQVKRAYRNSLDHSNARWIRNFNEKLVKSFADRVMEGGENDLETIRRIDIDDVMAQSKYANLGKTGEDAMERLNKLIGIPKVKQQVEQFISLAEFNQKREEQGMETGDFTLHSLFLGNPGTGKTTVARIIGEILYQKGIIAEKKFIEVSQSDLIAGYIGQTALKTKEVLESALGGVLFIDEAYAITQGNDSNNFGTEAVNEILKFMEDHRRDIVIILAGYTKEMGEFMKTNSGLVSRVPHTFDFEDYTPDEIVQIGLLGLHNNGYKVDEEYYAQVVKYCYRNSDDHSNGRWVRNLNEKLIMVMSKRVAESENADINQILNEDLDALDDARGMIRKESQGATLKTTRVDENGYVLPN